jgi:hypothetical protein
MTRFYNEGIHSALGPKTLATDRSPCRASIHAVRRADGAGILLASLTSAPWHEFLQLTVSRVAMLHFPFQEVFPTRHAKCETL